jgi:DNA-binding response OmpR family regulator
MSSVLQGTTTTVLLTPAPNAKGTAAEYRHFGFSVITHRVLLDALLDVAHDPGAVMIVSSDVESEPLADVLDVAIAMCGPRVILGLGSRDVADAVRVGIAAGVRSTVELPLTPDRLRAAVKRLPQFAGEDVDAIRVGDLTIDPGRHKVFWADVPIDVTLREFSILLALSRAHPYVAPLDQLAETFAATATDPAGSIRVAITRIRTRLAEAGAAPTPAIESIRGLGYRLAC